MNRLYKRDVNLRLLKYLPLLQLLKVLKMGIFSSVIFFSMHSFMYCLINLKCHQNWDFPTFSIFLLTKPIISFPVLEICLIHVTVFHCTFYTLQQKILVNELLVKCDLQNSPGNSQEYFAWWT